MKIKIFMSLLLMAMLSQISIYAYEIPSKIRIGLESKYKNKASVQLSNSSIVIGTEKNGTFSADAELVAENAFSVVASNGFYVKLNAQYSSFEQAAQAGIVAPQVSGYYAYLGPYGSSSEAANAAGPVGGEVLSQSKQRVELKDGNKVIAVYDSGIASLQAGSFLGAINLGESRYRGVVEFNRNANGSMTAINVLTLDEYLYSAVASEMPSSWHIEALKAQSVAARSYMLTRIGVHTEYDLCDMVHCQNYLGQASEADSVTQAVQDTSGLVAYYNNVPINAVYFSSSGGHTDNSENVWVSEELYLKGVNDSTEYGGKVWTRTFTLQDITALLKASNANIGDATGIEIASVENNRVQKLIIKGKNGNKVLTKEEIRTFFAQSSGGSLESRFFTIGNAISQGSTPKVYVYPSAEGAGYNLEDLFGISASSQAVNLQSCTVQGKDFSIAYQPTYSAPKTTSSSGNSITLTGRGWGHGVGMSQFGAKALAELGNDFISILKHYYAGIEIK